MISRVSIATVYCSDQQAAYDFYVGKLGLEVRTDATSGGVRWLLVGPKDQPDLSLMLAEPGAPLPPGSMAALREVLGRGGVNGVTFAVEDCRSAVVELANRGAVVLHEPVEQPFGIEAVLDDGCGNSVAIIEYHH
jgi:catechol 2,3-dioxygenase-like lactoylglutathione lyase family enzyme